jgi:hypothetical protein
MIDHFPDVIDRFRGRDRLLRRPEIHFRDMIDRFPDMIDHFPDMIDHFPDMIDSFRDTTIGSANRLIEFRR